MTSTTKSSFVVCGLPGSGKTTFLAALWHLVQSSEIETCLKFRSLDYAEYAYINAIRDCWLKGLRQPRTVGLAGTVGIDLVDEDGNDVQVLFPDHSGETYDSMWVTRTCSKAVADYLKNRHGVLLFLRSEGMKRPFPLIDVINTEAEMHEALPAPSSSSSAAVPAPDDQSGKDWSAGETPDQVKIVDILQLLSSHLSTHHGEKLAIFVSAWDVVEENLSPAEFIEQELPLLHQYLTNAAHGFDIRIYGLSAQGGEYAEENSESERPQKLLELLDLENASARIKLVSDAEQTHDLTKPIAWLMS